MNAQPRTLLIAWLALIMFLAFTFSAFLAYLASMVYIASYHGNSPQISTQSSGSGLVLWLKADAGVTQVNGRVSGWTDAAGNYNVSQNILDLQPTYITNVINGKPVLRFSGGQWLYNPSNLNLNAGLTVVLVSMTTDPTISEDAVFLGTTGGASCRGYGYYEMRQMFDLSLSYGQGAPALTNKFSVELTTLAPDGTSVTFYRNGQQIATTRTQRPAQPLTNGLTIGAVNNTAYVPWRGDIAEVLIYDHQLSPPEMAKVDSYLTGKYGF